MPQSPLALLMQNVNSKAFQNVFGGAEQEMFVGQRHGALYEPAYHGVMGMGANVLTTPVTTTVGLATTYVGLCLSNPAASTKNLVLQNVSGAFVVAPSTITTIGLIVGYAAAGVVTHTTALTPQGTVVGAGATLQAKLDSACTLVGTPAWARVLGQAPTATTSFSFSADINGSIVIPPGGYVAIGTNIAGPTSGFAGSMLWEEVAP